MRPPFRAATDPLGIPAAFFYFLALQGSRINPPTDKSLKKCRGAEHVVVGGGNVDTGNKLLR